MSAVRKSSSKIRKSIPLVYLLGFNLILILFLFWQYRSMFLVSVPLKNLGSEVEGSTESYVEFSGKGSDLVVPLRFAYMGHQSKLMNPLREELQLMIDQAKQAGGLENATVFHLQLVNGQWTEAGDRIACRAGSLLKVPIMMTWLKMAEMSQGVLSREIYFGSPSGSIPGQTFEGSAVRSGKSYKVSELLLYMIRDSDNYAAYLLGQNMDNDLFRQLFADLGLSRPQLDDMNYALTANDYSRFFRVLFDARYLNDASSDAALDLLTQCTFRKGITRDLPAGLTVAHKFGEQAEAELHLLSEAGIVYLEGNPYLLVVMTRGHDLEMQAGLIARISAATYRFNAQVPTP
ncbi:MAG TPA: class A beta-lactamase-related serine hydrolase [Bacteroidales bacterium]|nr:class A beta-lactamase-related serine hydrolase [Bacteroidales bacterium]HSA43702.1 class A beta-lactamase-related serine hydrolase [Bacteroidales bacterium]